MGSKQNPGPAGPERFSLRGWATGRALAVEVPTGEMAYNPQGKEMRRHFQRLLKAPAETAS